MKNILVLGDDCIDATIVVDTSRNNPEKPDQKIWKQLSYKAEGGMMFNVRECLKALRLDVSELVATKYHGARTTKTRCVDENGNLLARVDDDRKNTYHIGELVGFLENRKNKCDAVVIADYNKGAITEQVLRVIEATVPEDVPMFLDSKRKDLYKFPRFKIKINDAEAQQQEKPLPVGSVVTLGKDGAYYSGTRPIVYYHAPAVAAVDVCGAGDAFMAGYVYGTLMGNVDPIIYGICNGSLSVQHRGCYRPTLPNLIVEINKYVNGDKIKEIK